MSPSARGETCARGTSGNADWRNPALVRLEYDMAIVQTVDFGTFRAAFAAYRRENTFSPEALEALYDWLDDLSDDQAAPIELDVIALCCDFTELDGWNEVVDYLVDYLDDMPDDDDMSEDACARRVAALRDWCEDRGPIYSSADDWSGDPSEPFSILMHCADL